MRHSIDTTIRRRVILTTIFVALIEWLLLEAMRAPYRPPEDLNSFLGTEKYAVPYMMGIIFLAWFASIVYVGCRLSYTTRDLLGFVTIVLILLAIVMLAVKYPSWLIVPPELMWK